MIFYFYFGICLKKSLCIGVKKVGGGKKVMLQSWELIILLFNDWVFVKCLIDFVEFINDLGRYFFQEYRF